MRPYDSYHITLMLWLQSILGIKVKQTLQLTYQNGKENKTSASRSASVAITCGIHVCPLNCFEILLNICSLLRRWEKPTREITRSVLTTSLCTIYQAKEGFLSLLICLCRILVPKKYTWSTIANKQC